MQYYMRGCSSCVSSYSLAIKHCYHHTRSQWRGGNNSDNLGQSRDGGVQRNAGCGRGLQGQAQDGLHQGAAQPQQQHRPAAAAPHRHHGGGLGGDPGAQSGQPHIVRPLPGQLATVCPLLAVFYQYSQYHFICSASLCSTFAGLR